MNFGHIIVMRQVLIQKLGVLIMVYCVYWLYNYMALFKKRNSLKVKQIFSLKQNYKTKDDIFLENLQQSKGQEFGWGISSNKLFLSYKIQIK